MSKNNNIKIFNILILLVFLFICACSTKKYKPEPWCEDVFIPGNEYYEMNLKHQEGYEIPPVLQASKILPPSMLNSKLYKIEENVYSDGSIDHFRVKSKWGTSMAAGFVILKTRINEVNALDSLDKLEGTSFFDGVWEAGKSIVLAPWNFLKLIARPFTSSGEGPTEEEIKEQKKLERIKAKEEEHQKKLDSDGDGVPDIEEDDSDIINVRYKRIIDDDKDFVKHIPYKQEETADVGTVQSMLGVDDVVYEILEQFHIDPDNTNETLKEKVRHLARQKANGKMTTILLPSVPVLTILSTTNTVVNAAGSISAYQDEKKQLEQIHDGLLLAGCSEKLIKRFQDNDGMSTFLKTILANNTIKLKKVRDAKEIIKLGMLVDDYEISWILMQSVDVLVSLYDEVKFVRFIKDSPLPTVVTDDNKVYITFAGDHIYWVKDTEMYFKGAIDAIKDSGIQPTQIEARIRGILSDRAKREIEKLGIITKPMKHVVYSIDLYNTKVKKLN